MERKINYKALLDSNLNYFVKRMAGSDTPFLLNNLDKIRKNYSKSCRLACKSRNARVKSKKTYFTAKQRRIYARKYSLGRPTRVEIMYVHGGGFIMGGLNSHDEICRDLCESTGQDITAISYRLSPEHRHPAAFQDIKFAFDHLSKEKKLILVGDSSGATLISILAHYIGLDNRILGQILVYPYLGGEEIGQSYKIHANAPMLTTNEVNFYLNCWLGTNTKKDFLPLRQRVFDQLPPTIVFTSSYDPLFSDGKNYVDKIQKAGGKALHIEGKGLVHGYLRARRLSLKAKVMFAAISTSILALSKGDLSGSIHNL